jgi:DNA-binding CsgD family transcriptional regulator
MIGSTLKRHTRRGLSDEQIRLLFADGCCCVQDVIRSAVERADAMSTPIEPDESDILDMLAEGLSQREISDKLGLKVYQVNQYVRSARLALGASTGAGAVRLWHSPISSLPECVYRSFIEAEVKVRK